MNSAHQTAIELIQRARAGDGDALGELLERHRPYLKLITQRMMGDRIAGRVDDSDIVQQTCISVFGNISKLLSNVPDEFIAWLRTIHERNIRNAIRDHAVTQKRSVDRQQSIDRSPSPEAVEPSATQTSPSQRLLNGEKAVELAGALSDLPADQREAVRLRYLEGLSLEDISSEMDRTKFSVAGLVKRGLISLRRILKSNELES